MLPVPDVGGVADDVSGRPITFLFLFGVGSDWLVGGASVGNFPGFLQNLILISSFSSDIEWGWGPKILQPPGEVNTKNYQNDFFKGGKHGKHNTDTIYSATCMGEGTA